MGAQAGAGPSLPPAALTRAAALPAAAGMAGTAVQAAPARALLPSPTTDQPTTTSSGCKPRLAVVCSAHHRQCHNYAKRTRFPFIPSIFQTLKFKLLYI